MSIEQKAVELLGEAEDFISSTRYNAKVHEQEELENAIDYATQAIEEMENKIKKIQQELEDKKR